VHLLVYELYIVLNSLCQFKTSSRTG